MCEQKIYRNGWGDCHCWSGRKSTQIGRRQIDQETESRHRKAITTPSYHVNWCGCREDSMRNEPVLDFGRRKSDEINGGWKKLKVQIEIRAYSEAKWTRVSHQSYEKELCAESQANKLRVMDEDEMGAMTTRREAEIRKKFPKQGKRETTRKTSRHEQRPSQNIEPGGQNHGGGQMWWWTATWLEGKNSETRFEPKTNEIEQKPRARNRKSIEDTCISWKGWLEMIWWRERSSARLFDFVEICKYRAPPKGGAPGKRGFLTKS